MATITRRPLLKRVALWTAAVVLLLAGYLAGMPFAEHVVVNHVPSLEPAALAFYAPVIYAIKSEYPGTEPYLRYYKWCTRALRPGME
jgi:hypothetical protein